MKKITVVFTALLIAMCCCMTGIKADEYPGIDTDWKVTFNGKTLTTNYKENVINEALKGMQPGDSATLEFTLENKHDTKAYWWMENKVLKSLEDGSVAAGGAYSYELLYQPAGGKAITIYSSNSVGGSANTGTEREGLHEATEALKDDSLDEEYFYLGEIEPGKEANITIKFKLEGETQANSYQDTLGKLRIKFAVELIEPKKIIITGDDSHLGFYIATASVSAVAVAASALYLIMSRKDGRKHEKA